MINKFCDFNTPFIIAEIGGNHEGNFDYAKRLMNLAIESGVQAVKFQTYYADKIVSKITGGERHRHFQKFELQIEQFIELAKEAEARGCMFMSSCWDPESIAALDPYIAIHKVGSGDLTNYPILEILAKKNKPLILSTAMSTLAEVQETVEFINSVNPNLIFDRKLALLQCVAMYGEPRDEYANLLAIRKLQDTFPNIPIGYSDHTKGIYACELAIAMGAVIIEKHFTDDPSRSFRDHHISATGVEMKNLLAKSQQIKTLLGEYEKQPVKAIETEHRIQEFRRAVYLKESVKAGTILTRDILTTLRPNQGIDARQFFNILGKKLRRDLEAFAEINQGDLLD